MAALQTFEWTVDVGEDDLPADRFSDHVNNARYFVHVNGAFQAWYRAMGIRGGVPGFAAAMAHLELDFLREVRPPSRLLLRLVADRAGRTSLGHAIELIDLGRAGDPIPEPVLAARGRAVHVWVDRDRRAALPWPADVLARCWPDAAPAS